MATNNNKKGSNKDLDALIRGIISKKNEEVSEPKNEEAISNPETEPIKPVKKEVKKEKIEKPKAKKEPSKKKQEIEKIEDTTSDLEKEVKKSTKGNRVKSSNKQKLNEEEIQEMKQPSDEDGLTVYGLATLSDDVYKSTIQIPANEIRFLVDSYYQSQEYRKSTDNQIRSIEQGKDGDNVNEVPTMLRWLASNVSNQEKQVKKALEYWISDKPVGQWMTATVGIGPILAAAFLAYFDITQTNYAGGFWSFAGLNDNNNPWLGKDGAKKVLKELDEILKERNDERITDSLNMVKNSKYQATIKRIIKAVGRNTFVTMIMDAVDMSLSDLVFSVDPKAAKNDTVEQAFAYLGEDGIELLKQDIIALDNDPNKMLYVFDYFYNTKMINDEIVEIVAGLTHRSISTIIKGTTDENGLMTRKKLESYLPIPPYSTELKTLCWKLGDSFVKRSNHPDSLYGKLYKERKAYEHRKNAAGDYAEEAARQLREKNYSDSTEAKKIYESGKLPDGHIDARARRWTVKLFISHLFEAMYLDYYGKPAPEPYILAYDEKHHDYIEPEVPFDRFIHTK